MKTSCHRTSGGPAVTVLACLLAAFTVSCGDRGREMGIAEEYPPTNEAAVTSRLIELTKQALEERHASGKTLRFNQARHPGCVRADFAVEPGLAADLGVGLFAEPRSYPTWIRFATASTESDTEEDFRGMSLKLMGVEGEMLHGDGANFDFVLNSSMLSRARSRNRSRLLKPGCKRVRQRRLAIQISTQPCRDKGIELADFIRSRKRSTNSKTSWADWDLHPQKGRKSRTIITTLKP